MHLVQALFVFLTLSVVGCLGVCTLQQTSYTYSVVSGHYYQSIKCVNDNWDAARAYAESLSHPTFGQGYLWEIDSNAERMSLASSLLWPGSLDLFIGGYDALGNNNWNWVKSNEMFYYPPQGCTTYCNWRVGFPATGSGAQGLRIRGPGWVNAGASDIVAEAWAFVEYGCCDCGNRGVCNTTTCQCDCGSNYVGPHCEVYIGGCRYPNAPVCDPITPICIKP